MHIPRRQELFALFSPVSNLQGIGEKTSKILQKKIGHSAIDLLRHLPVSINDRRSRPSVSEAIDGQLATFEILVLSANLPPPRTKRPARIIAETKGGKIELIFFRAQNDYLQTALPVGEKRLISGRVERFKGKLQMSHPDYILSPTQSDQMPEIEPIYPLSAGLRPKLLRRAILSSLEFLPATLPEWISPDIITQKNWPDFKSAMIAIHHPKEINDLMPLSAIRSRLAFDEVFANQLALGLLRKETKQSVKGKAVTGTGNMTDALLADISFTPTDAQLRVIAEIRADQQADARMLRLLQGDVGSGKTFVAVMAMLTAIESGFQAAILVPTETLARQHHQNLNALLAPLNIEVDLLLGSMKTSARKTILEKLATHTGKIVIGTHALLSDDVEFYNLGLAIVDEQHRFGVRQRLILGQKGNGCDVLVMTATPIPRTLSMTAYGDLQISYLDEKPAHRQDTQTALISMDRLDQIIDRVNHALADNQRIYWICPLVEETDKLDIAAAEDRFALLQKLLPDSAISLVHGRMKTDQREQAMADFKSGNSQILVATTVIEVGVDIPEASIILIEHAERFGLATLHQLRGRVGRGDKPSVCILLYQKPLTDTAKARLKIMRETNNGFIIAEKDLHLRGPGEVLGQRQSGLPEFALVDLIQHIDLIELARQQADQVLANNLPISDEKMRPYAVLLNLFEQDTAVKFLNSG